MQRVRLLTLLLMCFAVTQVLTAQTSSRKMRVKFSAPVEIPAPNTDASVMTLPAGTYIFKLLRSESNRNIVQVLNEREDKVYSTILAVPDYRLNASSKTVMYFSERGGAGSPSAIKSWFYPGDNSGSRFVYPKARAQAIAAAENVPIPSFSEAKPITQESIAVPVQVQTPAKQEVPYVAANLQQTDVADKAGTDGEPVQAAALPKTASPIYAYAVAGLLLLGIAFVLRRINT